MNTKLHFNTTFTHNTKEVIQLIKFIRGEIQIPYPFDIFCFRNGINSFSSIKYSDENKKLLDNSKIIILEICSKKKYIYNFENVDYYLHHLCVDKRFNSYHNTPEIIKNNYKLETQTDEEIISDLKQILELLKDKKVVIVSHYNSKINGNVFVQRDSLIKLLEKFCKDYNIPFVNPTEVLKDFPQEKVIQPDLGHDTPFGLEAFTDRFSVFMNNFVNEYVDKECK